MFVGGEALSIMDFSVFNMSWESWHDQASNQLPNKALPDPRLAAGVPSVINSYKHVFC